MLVDLYMNKFSKEKYGKCRKQGKYYCPLSDTCKNQDAAIECLYELDAIYTFDNKLNLQPVCVKSGNYLSYMTMKDVKKKNPKLASGIYYNKGKIVNNSKVLNERALKNIELEPEIEPYKTREVYRSEKEKNKLAPLVIQPFGYSEWNSNMRHPRSRTLTLKTDTSTNNESNYVAPLQAKMKTDYVPKASQLPDNTRKLLEIANRPKNSPADIIRDELLIAEIGKNIDRKEMAEVERSYGKNVLKKVVKFVDPMDRETAEDLKSAKEQMDYALNNPMSADIPGSEEYLRSMEQRRRNFEEQRELKKTNNHKQKSVARSIRLEGERIIKESPRYKNYQMEHKQFSDAYDKAELEGDDEAIDDAMNDMSIINQQAHEFEESVRNRIDHIIEFDDNPEQALAKFRYDLGVEPKKN